jgi:hypothetical protein
MTSSTNGLPPAAVPGTTANYEYDRAGRIRKLTSSWPDPAYPSVLFDASHSIAVGTQLYNGYSPFGLTLAEYGVNQAGTTSLGELRSYDVRGRVAHKSVYGTGSSVPTPTTTTVNINPPTFNFGTPTTVTIQVSCGFACGNVDIKVDGVDFGTVPLDASGTVSFSTGTTPNSSLTVGTHHAVVQYLGNGTYAASTGTADYTVTGFSVAFAPSPIQQNGTGRITITTSCQSACGTASTTVDTTYGGGFTLHDGGTTTLLQETQGLSVGTHSLSVNIPQLGGVQTINFEVQGPPLTTPNTMISVSPSTFTSGQSATATVSIGYSDDSFVSNGSFFVDNNWVGGFNYNSVALNGVYSTGLGSYPVGTYTLRVDLAGTPNHPPSSASTTFTVQ